MQSPRLFLIDTYGFIFRAYHARARTGATPMRTSTGLSTEVVFIFSNMLCKLTLKCRTVQSRFGGGPTPPKPSIPAQKQRDQLPLPTHSQLRKDSREMASSRSSRNLKLVADRSHVPTGGQNCSNVRLAGRQSPGTRKIRRRAHSPISAVRVGDEKHCDRLTAKPRAF